MEEKKKLSWKAIGIDKLALLFLAGIILIFASLPRREESSGTSESTEDIAEQTCGQDRYEEYLEKKLETLLSGAAGAGNVKVMITLKSGPRKILQTNTESESSDLTEEDSGGGTRQQKTLTEKSDTFTSGDRSPVVIQELMPEVEGVVILSDGADRIDVKNEIIEAVQALFPLETHKIKVLKHGS